MNLRKLSTLAAAVITAACSVVYAQQQPIVYDPDMMIGALSDNGKWAISSIAGDQEVDNPVTAGGWLIDVKNHTKTKIEAPSGYGIVNDVADNGVVVGSEAGLPGFWSPETGKWTTFKNIPVKCGGGCFLAVTPDARFAVGYLQDKTDIYSVIPMYYDLTTGESRELPGLPTVDMTGLDQKQNLFYGISPDGRYVLGQMSPSYILPPSLFSYIYDTQTNTWKAIGYDYNASTKAFSPKVQNLFYIDNQQFSCDGKWVTGGAYMVFGGGELEGGSEGFYPYRYNVTTDVLEVYSTDDDKSVIGNKITADGTVLACSPHGSPYPTAMIRSGKYFIPLDLVFSQIYGKNTMEMVGDPYSGAFNAISADGLTAVMHTYDNCYIITMPEPFADAAARIDLLANYSASIPAGATISTISEISITFDRSIGCRNQASGVKLLDETGKEVRSASGFTVAQANDKKLTVTFRPYTLTPGMKYTVHIPEGYVWLKDDTNVKAGAIELTYTGRNEGAVGLKSANPADGSTIAVLNTSPDFITLYYDTPVAVADGAVATLYNDDDNSVVGTLNGMADGTAAIFRPTTSLVLYKGSNYRVEIPAGCITDLSGAGANEALTLKYKGAYTRQIQSDDIYIFNSPCEDYDNFMYWKDEFNTPAATPANWGFTEETPWILIRGSEESTNQAMCAHSMFSKPAASNSWLVTPQLYIPDENAYLAFDAQSYLRSKDDNLKVYVLEDDAIYNYLNEDVIKHIRDNGSLVIDEIIPAGATDEGIDGEWSRYTVTLEKYAGKNIYIAFAYENYDKSAVFLDNVQVVREMTFIVTNRTPEAVVNQDNITVSGFVTIASEVVEYDGISVTLKDYEGNVIDTLSDPDIKLGYEDTWDFTFTKPLALTPGEASTYVIDVASGIESSSFRYTVKDLTFEPARKVVLEEFTGSACGNCPLGIRAIENLQKLYPESFIPITVRAYNNDVYCNGLGDYPAFLGMNAAPSGRVNRGDILSPVLQNGSAGYTFFGRGIIESSGQEAHLWADEVQDLLNIPAEAEITCSPVYDPDTRKLTIDGSMRFALNESERPVNVFAVVLESRLPTYQSNYCNNETDPLLGEWGAGGIYGSATVLNWLADDVVRWVAVDKSYNGIPFSMSDFTAGKEYAFAFSTDIPENQLFTPSNCDVVIMLIDGVTGKVINADKAPFSMAGISGVVNDDTQAIYYNLQGQKVANPVKGNIYIKVLNGKSTKIIAK